MPSSTSVQLPAPLRSRPRCQRPPAALETPTHADSRDCRRGREIFRFDTFGDEQLWTNVLRMHEVIATVDPVTALGVGLKVDVDALPREIIQALHAGAVDLTDRAATIALLRNDPVVRIKGQVEDWAEPDRAADERPRRVPEDALT